MSKTTPARPTYSEDDWIQIRAHFMGSILVDVHLHKLAKNMGASWPIKKKDESPAKYLEYSFEELANAPGLAGHPSRLQLLLDILKETASFDDPFQNMMEAKPEISTKSAATDQILQKLEISPDFPLKFTTLSSDTRELCEAEGAVTVGQCASLLQRMAQSVILGGEVRGFLNSLAHCDERALRQYLPLRPGTHGPRLAETYGILIRNLPDAQRAACLAPSHSNQELLAQAQRQIQGDTAALLEWFPAEAAQLRENVAKGQDVERFFHPLGDAALEKAAARLAFRCFSPEPATGAEQAKSEGLVGRLTGLFRSS